LFSIVIPLEYHRGQWEQSWLGWTSQTIERSLYEIILVVPPDFAARESLQALARDDARIEFADCSHDIGLCALGAAKARGKYLFFTESHCRPEPDVLELCMRAIEEHPDWSGFSCRSIPISHNALSVAEAEMYQADIDFGMKAHPWRKVLDQCFVTRRDVYEECGGLRAEFGHFAEWLLAASYHARGHIIGYLDEARFHHYYVGKLAELEHFTLDFVQGEIRYLGEGSRDPGRELLDVPIEWICQDDFEPDLARSAFGALLRDSSVARSWRRPDEKWHAFWRWTGPALSGDRLARGAAFVGSAFARSTLAVSLVAGSKKSVARRLKNYIAALIHLQRLACIHAARRKRGAALPRLGEQVLAQAGFHAPETLRGQAFRWSEPVAAIRIDGLPGRNIVRIRCLAARGPLDRIRPRFYLEGARVADGAVATTNDSFVLCLDLPPSGAARLAWVCSRLSARDDRRRLGLPIAEIEVGALSGAGAAALSAAAD
jgi:hypothetical protein